MTEPPELPLRAAQLDWTEDGTPLSRQFGDIYFSKENGIAETLHVFLDNNNFEERFTRLAKQEHADFTIGETGFGTGLNFLCAWQLRDQIAPNCRLHFVSVEKHPLNPEDLCRALAGWHELQEYADQLIRYYPPLTPGWHRISFIAVGVELNLYLGDALEGYRDYRATIDTWFLDGFAPSKNPPMWSQQLFAEIGRLSRPGTGFATFSAAAHVREGLKQVGFEVNRVKGFAQKKHMLRGRWQGNANNKGKEDKESTGNRKIESGANHSEATAPWFITPISPTVEERSAIVIGGGIAGSSAAHSLARRGWHVTLFERHRRLGNEGSGNRQGILYNKISAEPSINSGFYTSGYLYTVRLLNQIRREAAEDIGWHPTGVLQLAYNDKERERQVRFLERNPQPSSLVYPVDTGQASDIAGIPLSHGGLFYPDGGWATPAAICTKLTDHPNITIRFGVEIDEIEQDGDNWRLIDGSGSPVATTKTLIIANAGSITGFDATRWLPLKVIRGQTTDIPANPELQLKTVLCGKGYIGPIVEGRHYMGATFNLDCTDTECRRVDHVSNLNEIAGMAPLLAKGHNFNTLQEQEIMGRVGFRCTSPDYLPLIGPMPNRSSFLTNYAPLRKNALHRFTQPGEYLPGLYISVGHGSKGLTSSPLGGELLAAYINNEPLPISSTLAHALNPARFLIRDLKRNKI